MNWHELRQRMRGCTKCHAECFWEVRCPDDRCSDDRVPLPRDVRLLFISEAPPLNTHSYFYYENTPNRLRRGLFESLRRRVREINSIDDFFNAGFYLLPTVKCPSAKGGQNIRPRKGVVKLCAEHYLKRELEYILEYIRPDCICLLGRTALHGFRWLCTCWDVPEPDVQGMGENVSEVAGRVFNVRILDRNITVIPTYWPTERHGRFNEIGNHIRRCHSII